MCKKNYQLELTELAKGYPQQSFEQGLSKENAREKLVVEGPNKLTSQKKPRWQLFVRQFNNLIIYILMAAASLTLLMGHVSDAIVIAFVIIANALIGYYQEASASDALEKIKQMLSQQATVYREGQRIDLPAEELVTGDVVFLEAGDNVPADLRLVACDNLRIQEAGLTGEADSIEKQAQPLTGDYPLAEQNNMAFASTSVTNGSGLGVVVATAEATELGQISQEVRQVKKRRSPLMRQIDQIGKGVSSVVLVAAAVLFVLGLLFETYSLTVLALAVVTMIVGSIPEGLPATTSVILAMGVSEMAKKQQTIVKSLPAVETLGSVNVIATDKTGTLTKNEMTVTDLILPTQQITVTGLGYEPVGQLLAEQRPVPVSAALQAFLQGGFEANDTELVETAGQWHINGEPTDGAFLTLYHKVFEAPPKDRELDLLPFDSDYRYIAKLVETRNGQQKIWIKGSPDKLIPLAKVADPDFDVAVWEQRVAALSKTGKRVVAVGVKNVTNETKVTHELLASGITWLGLAGIIDPPKEEVITALSEMKQAGVAVKMITGDHPLTAQTIGEKLGLAEEVRVITGARWDELTLAKRSKVAVSHQVFARMTPKNKLEIIEALQASGAVTAMTGDGVNDAPALKQADIGVAMGRSGTDVAKDSADMILANDNFAMLAKAIAEGRRIYDNIKKSILFLLPTSFAEGLIIAFTILAQQPMLLQATQLLWINMVSAITIQFAFIFEPAEERIMERAPREQKSLMDRHDIFQMGYVSVLMAVISLLAYEIVIHLGADQATASTMMVNVIVVSKIFYFFNIRSSEPAFSERVWANRKAFLIIGLMIGLQVLLTYAPFMQQIFQTTSINLMEWGLVIAAGALVLAVTEGDKWVRKSRLIAEQQP